MQQNTLPCASSRLTYAHIYSIAPADYTPTTVGLTFNPGNIRRCVNILIEDDNRIEGDSEVFGADLATSDSDINLDPRTAAIVVLDNDGKSLRMRKRLLGWLLHKERKGCSGVFVFADSKSYGKAITANKSGVSRLVFQENLI